MTPRRSAFLPHWRHSPRLDAFLRIWLVLCLVLLPLHPSAHFARADCPPADCPPADCPPADCPPADCPPADDPPADDPPADDPPADDPPADDPPADDPPADSDGDGLPDEEENQTGSDPDNPDSDQDGVSDGDEINITDTDPNEPDSDGDGVSDYNDFYGNFAVNVLLLGPGVTPWDWDGDGISDPEDPNPFSALDNEWDSDGDAVPDNEDSDPADPYLWNDWSRNGWNDNAEPTANGQANPNDADGDGVADENDSDPSNRALVNDWNHNGINDDQEDWDGDGIVNFRDSHPNNNCLWCDWNGNGVNDDMEGGLSDSDQDGYADNRDSHPFNATLWNDWNSTGINDEEETATSDHDDDGVADLRDSHPRNASLWNDWNHNGTNDSDESTDPDTDGDGHADNLDSDPTNAELWCDGDHNGVNDDQFVDTDGDGHPDFADTHLSNPDLWNDTDNNNRNDEEAVSTVDSDDDGVADGFDSDPLAPALSSDWNRNGTNDSQEAPTDSDGDGYIDRVDSHPLDGTLWNDHNHDGINDEAQTPVDTDNDGIPDYQDQYPRDFDNDGLPDAEELLHQGDPANADTDGDGLSDGVEAFTTNTSLNDVDTDGDGLTDFEEATIFLTDPLTPNEVTTASTWSPKHHSEPKSMVATVTEKKSVDHADASPPADDESFGEKQRESPRLVSSAHGKRSRVGAHKNRDFLFSSSSGGSLVVTSGNPSSARIKNALAGMSTRGAVQVQVALVVRPPVALRHRQMALTQPSKGKSTTRDWTAADVVKLITHPPSLTQVVGVVAGSVLATTSPALGSTKTTLTSSVNPTVVASSTIFTATVKATPSNAVVSAGQVAFKDGATQLGVVTLNSLGVATLSVSSLTVGTHKVSAVYSGNASYAASTSAVFSQVVKISSVSLTTDQKNSYAVALGKKVTDTTITLADTDGDGIADAIEQIYYPRLNPKSLPGDPTDAEGDLDGDGVSNLVEFQNGTPLYSPAGLTTVLDFDGDGMTDIEEDFWGKTRRGLLNKYRFADAALDSDGDGLLNVEEAHTQVVFTASYDAMPTLAGHFVEVWTFCSDPGAARTINIPRPAVPAVPGAPPRPAILKAPILWGLVVGTFDNPMPERGPTRVSGLEHYGMSCPASLRDSDLYFWARYGRKLERPTQDQFFADANLRDLNDNKVPDGYEAWQRTEEFTDSPPGGEDADDDGLPSLWEMLYGFDYRVPTPDASTLKVGNFPILLVKQWAKAPAITSSTYASWKRTYGGVATADPDGDGLSNQAEYYLGTNPRIVDSDGDGFPDGVEYLLNSNPRNPDSEPSGTWTAAMKSKIVTNHLMYMPNYFKSLSIADPSGGNWSMPSYQGGGGTSTPNPLFNSRPVADKVYTASRQANRTLVQLPPTFDGTWHPLHLDNGSSEDESLEDRYYPKLGELEELGSEVKNITSSFMGPNHPEDDEHMDPWGYTWKIDYEQLTWEPRDPEWIYTETIAGNSTIRMNEANIKQLAQRNGVYEGGMTLRLPDIGDPPPVVTPDAPMAGVTLTEGPSIAVLPSGGVNTISFKDQSGKASFPVGETSQLWLVRQPTPASTTGLRTFPIKPKLVFPALERVLTTTHANGTVTVISDIFTPFPLIIERDKDVSNPYTGSIVITAVARDANNRLSWTQEVHSLLPIEVEVQRADRDGNGHKPTDWESQASGTIDDLLSIWEKGTQNGRDWINVRLKGLQGKNLNVTWIVDGLQKDQAADPTETGKLRWQGAGGDPYTQSTNIRKVEAQIDNKTVASLLIDIPQFPVVTDATLQALALSNPQVALYLDMVLNHSNQAKTFSEAQVTLRHADRNAVKHGLWHILNGTDGRDVAMIGLLAGFKHEYEGKINANSRSCGSTMDLHNNLEGAKGGMLLAAGGAPMNVNQLGQAAIDSVTAGQFWIWHSPADEEHKGNTFDATLKGNNEHITSK